jgi:bile acid:Na+ symporter, BASS family
MPSIPGEAAPAMLQRFLPVWLLLLSAAAFWWPETRFAFDPFLDPKTFADSRLAGTPYDFLGLIFAFAMFAIGTLLPPDEISGLVRKWPTVFLGTGAQYLVMPLLAVLLAMLLPLSLEARMGVILAGSVPGAMASNVLTLQAKGNVSYSVSLTATATILSPLVVPAVLSLAFSTLETSGRGDFRKPFDPIATGLNLLCTVAIPVVSGYLVARYSPSVRSGASRFSELSANLVILWIIAVIVALNRERFEVGTLLLVALVILNVAGYLAGYGTGKLFRLDEPMRRALTLEVGMQNAGLGAVLAGRLFPDNPAVAIPTVVYMFGCMLTGTLLAAAWRRRSIADAAIFHQAAR